MAETISNVISEGFELVRENYLKFLSLYLIFGIFVSVIIVVALVPALLFSFGSGIGSNSLSNASGAGLFIFLVIVVLAIIFLVEPLLLGSYYAIALQYLNGQRVSVIKAFVSARQRYVQLLWTMALETVIFVVVDAVIFSSLLIPASLLFKAYGSAGSLSSPAVAHALILLIGWALLVMIVYLIVILALAPLLYEALPLVMLEGVSGMKAIKESVDLGRANFWSIVWLVVLIGIIVGVIGLAQNVIIGVVNILNVIAGSLVSIVLSIFVGSFITAWLYVLPVIFYRDFLSKKKG